ncbi:TPA: hypothetical protein DHW51_13945 [Candidatus Poribacteria bacterium]|jgi:SAM-dependent methyltransferase|nr:hypothetical protein [Candidatus Poribacteria bacterium]
MAIEASYLSMLKKVIDIAKKNQKSHLKALCLAYPDLLVNRQALINLFSEDIVSQLSIRQDADEIWAWHGLKGCQEPLYDTEALFRALGVDLEVIDIVSARGNERIVDLNMPLPDNLRLRFDLVIDTGTCEHCFNVAQAFMNSCQALAIGGYLVHAAPINKCNHGFWNFCPGVYPDFLGDNGFEIIYMSGILFSLSVCKQSGKVREELKTFKISPFDRFKLPTESIIYVVAKRVNNVPMRWPVQRKYRQ